jgi:branched-chain amino acid transport system substrate-binding protein
VPAEAQVKIGFISTLSGPQALLGQDMLDAFTLAVKHYDGKLGGVPTTVVSGDDQAKPDVAIQVANRMIKSDHVDIVAGVVFSNVLLAISRPVLDSGTFLITANAGPSDLAGKGCHPHFFAASWQNDNTTEAVGQYLSQTSVKRVYLMAANYQAGKDKLAGLRRFYKGEVVDEVYTPFGQLDFSVEIAQLAAAKPDAVFIFYPGAMGINFIKQFRQAGLGDSIALYGELGVLDQTVLPSVGDAALGAHSATEWSEAMDNPANKRFVADFEATYKRIPSFYAAQAYDTARLIDGALRMTGGKVNDKEAFAQALHAAKFDSIRGKFRFNTNNFPIQDWYVTEIVKDAKGRPVAALRDKIFTDHPDAYADQCPMKG